MMMVRSILFNTLFYGTTALFSLLLFWTCFLPRPITLRVARIWCRYVYFLERTVMGINYTVKGTENIPQGPVIIAAKHQSAWETMKLHLLFSDPSIVLKKELLAFPFWGWFLKKLGMVAIDRKKGAKAFAAMIENAREIKKQNRPIVIFPQGTRVPVGRKMSYKYGVAKLYEKLDIPIVPMALNAGVFWPKNSFFKHPGQITIEFLPPIMPGKAAMEALTQLQKDLDSQSEKLSDSALSTIRKDLRPRLALPVQEGEMH